MDQWYFAYGSNLSTTQKEERTGSIRESCVARLSGYRIVFNKRSNSGTVVANIVPDDSESVWGVVYLCNSDAITKMDKREGVADGHYVHRSVLVESLSGERIDALAYVAGEDFICEPAKPSATYLETILDGARQHGLPSEYIAHIEWLAR
jgi:cation transport regulator ChaC